MVVVYADTSFLVSLYGQDANSAEAQQLAAELSAPFALTPLLHHEARNAIRFAVFRKDITKRQCESVLQVMGEDIKTGAPARSPVAWAEVFDRAEALSASHTNRLGTRATDILHVASAAVLGIQDFLTFDSRHRDLAHRAGMTVRPA